MHSRGQQSIGDGKSPVLRFWFVFWFFVLFLRFGFLDLNGTLDHAFARQALCSGLNLRITLDKSLNLPETLFPSLEVRASSPSL